MSNSKLYRSSKNRIIAGVCGGIAEHFNADPLLVRLLTVVFCLVFGAGIILYLAAALILPRDDEGDIVG